MTTSLPWFRVYDEALDDPKVQRLPDALFRTWFNLLCLANRGTPRGRLPVDLDDMAYALRMNPRVFRHMLSDLLSRGLLIKEEGSDRVMPNNWDARQKKSDSSAERVANHRASKTDGNVTQPLPKRPCNAVDTDTDIEEEAAAAATAHVRAREAAAAAEESPTKSPTKKRTTTCAFCDAVGTATFAGYAAKFTDVNAALSRTWLKRTVMHFEAEGLSLPPPAMVDALSVALTRIAEALEHQNGIHHPAAWAAGQIGEAMREAAEMQA